MTRLAVLALLCLALGGGCADVASLGKTFNDRRVTSCIWFSGSYGPFVGIHGVTATGGATIDQCESFH